MTDLSSKVQYNWTTPNRKAKLNTPEGVCTKTTTKKPKKVNKLRHNMQRQGILWKFKHMYDCVL